MNHTAIIVLCILGSAIAVALAWAISNLHSGKTVTGYDAPIAHSEQDQAVYMREVRSRNQQLMADKNGYAIPQ